MTAFGDKVPRDTSGAESKDLRKAAAIVRPLDSRLDFHSGDQPGRLRTRNHITNACSLVVWQYKAHSRPFLDESRLRQVLNKLAVSQ